MTAEPNTSGARTRTDEAPAAGDERSAEARAEEIVERVSAEVVRFARRLVGRAREEIEDVVAEAQSLRHGQRPPH
jgi:glycerol-3-phosphate O-acyltransferase